MAGLSDETKQHGYNDQWRDLREHDQEGGARAWPRLQRSERSSSSAQSRLEGEMVDVRTLRRGDVIAVRATVSVEAGHNPGAKPRVIAKTGGYESSIYVDGDLLVNLIEPKVEVGERVIRKSPFNLPLNYPPKF